MRGDESDLLSPTGADELLDELADAELVTIPGAGHHIHLDQPERTLSALLEFLHRDSAEA
jgi:pimeloyl-ACP methyl ester carboxylesterase